MQYNDVRIFFSRIGHNNIAFFSIQYLDEDDIPKSLPVFKWLPIHNVTFLEHCRNSQQGSSLIVDELGEKAMWSNFLPMNKCVHIASTCMC